MAQLSGYDNRFVPNPQFSAPDV